MRTSQARLILAIAFLIMSLPGYGLTCYLIHEVWLRREHHAIIASTLIWAPVFAGLWLLIWGPRVIWNRRRVIGTLIVVGAALLAYYATYALSLRLDESDDKSGSVVLGAIAGGFFYVVSTALLWAPKPSEKLSVLRRDGFKAIPCPKCGYDLRGATEARCPECGHACTIDELFLHVLTRHDTGAVVVAQLHNTLRRWVKWSLIAVGSLAAIGLIAALVGEVWTRAAYESELAAWEAVGGVRDVNALAPEPIADDVNAAVLLRQAIAALPPDLDHAMGYKSGPGIYSTDAQSDAGESGSAMPSPHEVMDRPWSVKDEILNRIVKLHEPSIDLTRQAARQPQCVWRTDFSGEGVLDDLWGDTAQTATLGDALICQAVVEARAGRFDEVAELIGDALMLGRHVAAARTTNGYFQYYKIQSHAMNACERLFRHAPLTSPRLRKLIEEEDPHALLPDVMVLQGASLIAGSQRESFYEEWHMPRIWPAPVLQRRDLALLMRRHITRYEVFREPFAAQAAAPFPEGDHGNYWTRVEEYDGWFIDILNRVGARLTGRFDMARSAIVLRERKAASGAYPDDSAWTAPPDVTGDGPMQYQRVEEGFVLSRPTRSTRRKIDTWMWDADALPEALKLTDRE